MKTNYMNAKQQMLTIALTVATVISLAWVSPDETKREIKTALENKKVEIKAVLGNSALQNLLCTNTPLPDLKTTWVTDTTKKRKVKIVTVDSNGVKKEYHSLKDVPNDLKIDLALDSGFNFSVKYDNFFALDSLKHLSLKILDNPEFKAIMKSNAEMMKSPEWKKMIEDHTAAAKQYSAALQKQMNSPEWKKQMADIMAHTDEIAKSFNTAEYKAAQMELLKELKRSKLELNSEELKKELESAKQLQSSAEYKKLKEQFEKDVEQLKQKKGIK